MAYFPHAYKKVFVAASVEAAAGQKSHQLSAGELALLDKTFTSVAAGGAVAGGLYYLAQGSYHTVDKLGPHHGGYKESVKSKGINPKFISKIWTVAAEAATAATATIETTGGEVFAKGEHVYLRVDVKGSPALRFLGRNSYFVADYTVDCQAGNTVEPAKVLLEIAAQITSDNLVGPFVAATVQHYDPAAGGGAGAWVTVTVAAGSAVGSHKKARLILTGAYVDTTFGNCSFAPTDFYEKEPVQILIGELDETGEACGTGNFTAPVVVAGVQGNGFGETVLREFILSNRYAQEDFQTDPRMREILNDIALTGVSRTASYKAFNILHNIPRSYNPSGMHNSDQYLLTVYAVDGSAAATAVGAICTDLADAAGVTVETY